MRSRYIVSYDISDPKRLRKVFRTMRGFGDPLQLSVFICELSLKELALMKQKLTSTIHHKDDRVMIVTVGPATSELGNRVEFMGKAVKVESRQAHIV
jgi:CRISPR-associated protein Cas2